MRDFTNLTTARSFCNMDFIVFSSFKASNITNLTISYDIACQFHKKLWQRHEHLPEALRVDRRKTKIKFAIPKFHLPAHHTACHTKFAFNFMFGAGLNEGEWVERDWSELNWLGNIVATMMTGRRQDTINDMCGFINFVKSLSMSTFTGFIVLFVVNHALT